MARQSSAPMVEHTVHEKQTLATHAAFHQLARQARGALEIGNGRAMIKQLDIDHAALVVRLVFVGRDAQSASEIAQRFAVPTHSSQNLHTNEEQRVNKRGTGKRTWPRRFQASLTNGAISHAMLKSASASARLRCNSW